MRGYSLLKRVNLFALLCLVALLLAAPSLWWRLNQEQIQKNAVIVADLAELRALKSEENPESIASDLIAAGVGGFTVPEYSAIELHSGLLPGVSLVSLTELPEELRSVVSHQGAGTVVRFGAQAEKSRSITFLSLRFPKGQVIEARDEKLFVIPAAPRTLDHAGILPDFAVASWLSSQGVPLVYRPGPGVGSIDDLLRSLDYVKAQLPTLRVMAPLSDIVVSMPNAAEFGAWIVRNGLMNAHVEFSTQVGSEQLVWASWPHSVSLHSVSAEEILTRKLNRDTILERMVRAAQERSVRLLLLRTDNLRGIPESLSQYCSDIAQLRNQLDQRGLGRMWPDVPVVRRHSLMAAMGLGLLFLLLAHRLSKRWFGNAMKEPAFFALILVGLACGAGALIYFVPFVAKLAGAFTTGLLATEVSLLAMDHWKAPLRGLLLALALTVAGGLVVAGFFSTTAYMLRLVTFSGVKVTLMLPLLLVLLSDLRNREHPESLSQVLARPPVWGELALAGLVALAALVVLIRSDNSSFVPGFERSARLWLEQILVARPRNKELFIGYPALIIWYFLKRHDLWGRYREVLRLAATLAFSSAVNSFCHFHTSLPLSVLRVFNGWWSGVIFGVVLLLVGSVIWRCIKPLVNDSSAGTD